MSGWNGDPPPIPVRRTNMTADGPPPRLPPPARPRLSGPLARAASMAMDERLPYTERALACRVTAALAAAEVTLAAQAQTLALLGIGDQLGAILAALAPPPPPPAGAPQPD